MFIELTSAYKNAPAEKFSLRISAILYFSAYTLNRDKNNYPNCNAIIETLGSSEGSQLYHVQETYDWLKAAIYNA